MARVDTGAAVQAGQDIFYDGDPAQPAGLVAQAAPEPQKRRARPQSGVALIVCLPIAAVEAAAKGAGRLTLGTPDGPPLADLHLPYPLLEDI